MDRVVSFSLPLGLDEVYVVVVPGNNVSDGGGKIDRHSLESVGDQGRRLDQHAIQGFRVPDDRCRSISRRSNHVSVQIQDRPGLLAGDGRYLGIEGSGGESRCCGRLLIYRCHGFRG